MKYRIRWLFVVITYTALQLAVCLASSGRYAKLLASLLFIVAVTVFLAHALYSKDNYLRAFSLGFLLPATIYVFGRTWVIDELLGSSVDDPFEEGVPVPLVLATIQAAGLACGALMLAVKVRIESRNEEVRRDKSA
jgi:hypothetical protein